MWKRGKNQLRWRVVCSINWVRFGCNLGAIWVTFGCNLGAIWVRFGCEAPNLGGFNLRQGRIELRLLLSLS